MRGVSGQREPSAFVLQIRSVIYYLLFIIGNILQLCCRLDKLFKSFYSYALFVCLRMETTNSMYCWSPVDAISSVLIIPCCVIVQC